MPVAKRCLFIEPGNIKISVLKQCAILSIHRGRYYYELMAETADNLAMMLWMDKQTGN